MKKWLVYKCMNAPVEVITGRVYDSSYEASFDTWEGAVSHIAIRNMRTDAYCTGTSDIIKYPVSFDAIDVFNGRTRKDYKVHISEENVVEKKRLNGGALEDYILKQIKEIDSKLNNIKNNDYSINDFNALFNRLNGQKDILYQCLTAHDNTYCNK